MVPFNACSGKAELAMYKRNLAKLDNFGLLDFLNFRTAGSLWKMGLFLLAGQRFQPGRAGGKPECYLCAMTPPPPPPHWIAR